jgi:hypothetical protein
MTIKTLVVAATLAVTSAGAGFANCGFKEHTAMSCAEGTVYDAESKTCVPQVSS